MRVLIFVMMFVSKVFSQEVMVESSNIPKYFMDTTWVTSNSLGEIIIYEFKPKTFTSKILDENREMRSFNTFDVEYKKVSDEQYIMQGYMINTSEYLFLLIEKIEEQKINVYLPLADTPNKKSYVLKFTATPQ